MAGKPERRVSMEDFRPGTLGEIVGQSRVIARLERIAEGVRAGGIVPPSLLFHGPPGIGKTTAARAFARAVLGEHYENSFTELKAFDDRSPNSLAEIILNSRKPPTRGAPFRILFFDEIEALSAESQNALRPAMEGVGGTTVYMLACNEVGGLSKALLSRCTMLEFLPLSGPEMHRLVAAALTRAPFELDAMTVESIVQRSEGIPREAIKLLLEEGGPLARRPAPPEGSAPEPPARPPGPQPS